MKKLLLLAIPLFVLACKKDEERTTQTTESKIQSKSNDIKETYANIAYATYKDSYDQAIVLKTTVAAFVASPSENTLTSTKQAWLDAREPYGVTEAFRFSNGPIDDINGPEGQLNAWPLDENYIDYVDGLPSSGIINDLTSFPTIEESSIIQANENGSETNISVGYHAIEFLLWGQDNTPEEDKLPGQRSYTDYTTEANADRRKEYLVLVCDLLVSDLKTMVDEWDPTISNNYRSQFLALENNEALNNIFTGISTLAKAELAGERIFVAYNNKSQEDEHSCFSDNTHRDIILNFEGCRNLYLGTYTKLDGTVISGTSLADLVGDVDNDLNTATKNQIEIAEEKVNAIPVPFDLAVIQSDNNVLEAVTELRTLGDDFSDAASALGLQIIIE